MLIPPINNNYPPYIPIPTVQPFTYRDGVTYWEKLNYLIKYIKRYVLPYIDAGDKATYDQLIAQFEIFTDQINDKIADINEIIQAIIDNSIIVQDPLVAQMINDINSDTRQALDAVYGDSAQAAQISDVNSDTRQTLDTIYGDSAQAAQISDVNSESYLAVESVFPYAKVLNPDNVSGYRKKIVHNLLYMHSDWQAAQSMWGSLFPQGFVIDEISNEILTISSSGIISVYDFISGAYKDHCFKLNINVLNQNLVIRRESGQKFLYARVDGSNFGKYNITNWPTNLTEITPIELIPVDSLYDYGYYNGYWYIGALRSDISANNFNERGKFYKYDNSFNLKGILKIDSMRYGGTVNGDVDYALSGLPKSQGLAVGPGMLAISIGGGYNTGETRPISDPFFNQGMRVFDSSGNVIADSLVSAQSMYDWFTELGYKPNHLEVEGASFAYNKFYSLYCIAASGTEAAQIGGLVLVEEFSNDSEAKDFAEFATMWNSPSTVTLSTGLHPLAPNGELLNPVTNETLNSFVEIARYMRSIGQQVLNFYSTNKNIVDGDGSGVDLVPDSYYIQCRLLNSSSLQVERTNTKRTSTSTLSWNGAEWVWKTSDTGWIDLNLISPFTANGNETPQIRYLNGEVKFRGSVDGANMTANGTFVIAKLPLDISSELTNPTVPHSACLAGSAVANNCQGRIVVNGDIQIRTGDNIPSYVNLYGLSGYIVG